MVKIGKSTPRAELASLRREVRRLRSELKRLTPSLEVLLRRRGFAVHKEQPSADLLVPAATLQDRYYRFLHKYSFRLFLRDVIKHQQLFTAEQLARYSTARTVRAYIAVLEAMGMAELRQGGYGLLVGPITSFGATLEWYVAELLRREFGAETIWGVKFRGRAVGGDYDVIAKLEGKLLYLEVKSSPPKQIYDSEVAAFLDRVEDLAPETAVFLMDTELRMKDKLVPMFEAALAQRSAYPPQVTRIERELFSIGDRIFIVNAKESILQNIGIVVGKAVRRGSCEKND
ncbi:MAG: hypothetical protein OEW15_14085 [Nitrospirota bacterium]|nr:hypothetical protein [Nitrospirota bacterium]